MWREENRRTRRKNNRSEARTNKESNSHMAPRRNQTQATSVGGRRSHHGSASLISHWALNCVSVVNNQSDYFVFRMKSTLKQLATPSPPVRCKFKSNGEAKSQSLRVAPVCLLGFVSSSFFIFLAILAFVSRHSIVYRTYKQLKFRSIFIPF